MASKLETKQNVAYLTITEDLPKETENIWLVLVTSLVIYNLYNYGNFLKCENIQNMSLSGWIFLFFLFVHI